MSTPNNVDLFLLSMEVRNLMFSLCNMSHIFLVNSDVPSVFHMDNYSK